LCAARLDALHGIEGAARAFKRYSNDRAELSGGDTPARLPYRAAPAGHARQNAILVPCYPFIVDDGDINQAFYLAIMIHGERRCYQRGWRKEGHGEREREINFTIYLYGAQRCCGRQMAVLRAEKHRHE